MNRDPSKNYEHLKDVQQDIQFLLSNIRARENGLIFFLERFTTESRLAEQFTVFKEEFMQKEKIYANQVSRIVNKYALQKPERISQQVRTFWIKVKSIVKVSLQRLKILSLLNEKIFARYEEIIALINLNYDEQKGLDEFNTVQNLLKKRNIDALTLGKNHFSTHNSDAKISKNRSQSAFKHANKYSPKQTNFLQQIARVPFDSPPKQDNEMRMKSLNQYRKKKNIPENKVPKTGDKVYKKIHKELQRYQKCFEGAMKGNIDNIFDKKKGIKENQEALYEQLFKKNIPNHKMISKFIFGSCGIASILHKKAKIKAKKVIFRIEKEPRQSKQLFKINKSKAKQMKQRPSSCQNNHFKILDEDKKRLMVQTIMLDKKGKYRKKAPGRIQKYQKLLKLIS